MHGTPPCECACGAASAAGAGGFSNFTSVTSPALSEMRGVSTYSFTFSPAGFSKTMDTAAPLVMSTESMFPGVPLIFTDAANDVAPTETCVVPLGTTTSYAVTAPSNAGSSVAGAFLNPALALKLTSPPSSRGSCASTDRKLITQAMVSTAVRRRVIELYQITRQKAARAGVCRLFWLGSAQFFLTAFRSLPSEVLWIISRNRRVNIKY